MSHGQVDFRIELKVKPSAKTFRHNLPESTTIKYWKKIRNHKKKRARPKHINTA